MTEVDKKVQKLARQVSFQSLKEKAFNKRKNLVVSGLDEDPNKDTSTLVKDFFSDSLKLKKVPFQSAHRLGSAPTDTSTRYVRPILVRFNNVAIRNRV